MKDEHPVKFAAETLADGTIMEPLKTWVLNLLPGAMVPEACKMFVPKLNSKMNCPWFG